MKSLRRLHPHDTPPRQEKKTTPFFAAPSPAGQPKEGAPFFQPKLAIGQPGDAYEQEADAVADAVVGGNVHAPVVQKQAITPIQRATLATPADDEKLSTAEARMEKDKLVQEKPELQRLAAPEEEEPVQMQAAEEEEPVQMQAAEEEEPVQAKRQPGGPAQAAGEGLAERLQSAQGNGQPLPAKARAEMEAAFGVGFQGVNVHTDAQSIQMNRELGAHAFTHGSDVYFNSGKFDPEASDGKHLLAHELTHVVQQGGNAGSPIQRTLGDGHDLASAELAGDLHLEAAYDDEKYIKFGAKGPHVEKLQRALVSLGYELPEFGVDGIFGKETKKAVKEFQAEHGLSPDGIVGPKTMEALDRAVGPGPAPEEEPSKTHSVEEYIDMWEKKMGRKMTEKEKETLAAGCIGITAINLGLATNPPLDNCYSSFEKAKEVAATMNQFIRDSGIKDRKAVIFSKRFWSSGKEYKPDESGKVDMTGYNYEARPGFTNFDYGFYDETTGKWWHANHADPGMEVYESTLDYYSRPLLDFDSQVFCVAISTMYHQ